MARAIPPEPPYRLTASSFADDPVSLFAANARPRRSLILAGGGMRVAWQAGVLRALEEAGLGFQHADGTSGGIFNLAMLLSGLSPPEMEERWRTLDVKRFASLLPLEEYAKAQHLPALGDADGLLNEVFPHLGIDVARIRAQRGIAGTFNVCNYTRKTNVAVTNERIDLDYLVAGVSLPIFLPPVAKDGALWLDSVWIKDANLWEAVRRGAEELWLVWCIGNVPDYRPGPFNQYVHMIELSANGKLFEELERIADLNARIVRGDSPFGQERPVVLHVIKPEVALPLDPDFYLGRIDAGALVGLGYQAAKRYLAGRSEGGLPLTSEATAMTSPRPGISFRETMAGSFALGETDPAKGAEKGKAAGSSLALHGTIFIDDLERFVAERDHAGVLVARLDFTPFANGIPSSTGRFNLFSPSEDSRLRLMVYEVGFEHGGEAYYLAGRKEVRDDPGFDAWSDTTTLLTRLHKGSDRSAPVVGAGILRLGVADLVRLVSTLRATGAETAKERTEATARFGRLFLGRLWDTYVKHVSAEG